MDLDLSSVLYERLSTDKYGGWVEVFGREALRGLCDRVEEELSPVIFEELGEIEAQLDEAQEDIETMINQLDKLGLDWNVNNKQLVMTEEFKLAVKELRF